MNSIQRLIFFIIFITFGVSCQQTTETTTTTSITEKSDTLSDLDPTRFASQIELYQSDSIDYAEQEVIVFTGSSSIRMWRTLATDFPQHIVLNRGFGGSQMSDLNYYKQALIFDYKPKKVFIYEGDNDIAFGKNTERIMEDIEALVVSMRSELPNTPLYFIGAKPSIARWNLAEQYLDFNTVLENYCKASNDLEYIDVWYPMLLENGNLNEAIFVEDGLHLNEEGYKIWRKAISPYL